MTQHSERERIAPHDSIRNRYEIRGILEMDTALHVGSGQESPTSDAAVVRDFQDMPFIPGSSLKGALRSAVERRADWLRLKSCHLDESYAENLNEDFSGCLTTNRRPESMVGPKPNRTWRQQDLDWRQGEMEKGLCDVCKTFGSTVFGGKVQIDDLRLVEDYQILASELFETRDGVAIDRDTGTAIDGRKFDYDVVSSLTAFRFYLTAENLEPPGAALLSLGLLEMSNGAVPIGGKSTRGLGRCRLHLTSLHYYDFTNNDRLASQRILDYLQRKDGYGLIKDKPEEFLLEKLNSFLNQGGNNAQATGE